MSIEKLEDSVTKSELKVNKCKSTIERHKNILEKKKKEYDEYGIKTKEQDIVGATKKLVEAETILGNWKRKLDIEIEKERFIEGNSPEVIKEFLESWKSKALNWHLIRYKDYQDYKETLKNLEYSSRVECIETTPEYSKYLTDDGSVRSDDNLLNVFPRKYMETYLLDRGLDWKSINSKKSKFAGSTVMHMDSIYDESERYNWIESKLEKEKKYKMIDLITRINNEIGEITEAKNLNVSVKGNLDGFIEGKKGTVKIETVGAGGFNIQCFHYRTLINKI